MKNFNQFINEDLSSDFAISNLFRKYERELKPEFDDENWVKYHYDEDNNGGMKALRESLEMIGNGEITDMGDDHLMYKEMLKDGSLILVVHARWKKSPYGGAKGLTTVDKNLPKSIKT